MGAKRGMQLLFIILPILMQRPQLLRTAEVICNHGWYNQANCWKIHQWRIVGRKIRKRVRAPIIQRNNLLPLCCIIPLRKCSRYSTENRAQAAWLGYQRYQNKSIYKDRRQVVLLRFILGQNLEMGVRLRLQISMVAKECPLTTHRLWHIQIPKNSLDRLVMHHYSTVKEDQGHKD